MLAPRPTSIDDFFLAAKSVRTKSHLFELFAAAVAQEGFDLVEFSVQYDPEIPPGHCGIGALSHFPVAWRQVYLDRSYAKFDPVLRRVSGLSPPFWWKDLPRSEPLTAQQEGVLKAAKSFGLHDGLTIPFRGPAVQKAAVSMARSAPSRQSIDLDRLVAISNHFFGVYKRLFGLSAALPSMAVLSDREAAILVRAAHGRTDGEIASVLGIQPTTIHYHWKSIFLKLEASTRTQAVAYALRDGMIEL